MKKYSKFVMIGFAILLITIDQAMKFLVCKNLYNCSKTIIKSIINITYIENTGRSF